MVDFPGTKFGNVGKRNRPSGWNIFAQPFVPSSNSVSLSTSLDQSFANMSIDRSNSSARSTRNDPPTVMSYSAALRNTKPKSKPPPIEDSIDEGVLEASIFKVPEVYAASARQSQPQQQQQTSKRNKPTKSIALGDFVFNQLVGGQVIPKEPAVNNDNPIDPHVRNHGTSSRTRPTPQKDAQKKQIPMAHPSSTAMTTGGASATRGNILDSTVPVLHKGKQRENPKQNYSRMKKVILKERKQQEEGNRSKDDTIEEESKEMDDELEDEKGISDQTGITTENATSVEATRPPQKKRQPVPNTRFLDNILSRELDQSVIGVITKLGGFQDRLHATNPDKAKSKRRLVYGLREVHKLLKVDKIKCVILAPNIESIEGAGGLDEMLNSILDLCREKNVPYFFALTKMRLGYVSHKHKPVSCAGILNHQGADDQYKIMLEHVNRAKEEFRLAQEATSAIPEQPPPVGEFSDTIAQHLL